MASLLFGFFTDIGEPVLGVPLGFRVRRGGVEFVRHGSNRTLDVGAIDDGGCGRGHQHQQQANAAHLPERLTAAVGAMLCDLLVLGFVAVLIHQAGELVTHGVEVV